MAYTTINKPSLYFNTLLWTGDGTNNRSITGVGFRPELAWTKRRDSGQGNTNHNLWNFLVGAGNNAELSSNTDGAEGGSDANLYGYISALNSDGFTLTDGTDATYKNLYTNNNGGTYVAWNWLANGTAVSNTQGTITSTVSANTTAGFSIVSYTGNGSLGQSIGHGLGVAPKMVIIKMRSGSQTYPSWYVRHQSMQSNYNARLELGAVPSDTITQFFQGGIANLTSSTTISFNTGTQGNANNVNANGNTYIGYCFAEVKGFSKFGSYTGNGSTDGTFVYTGFKPAFIMIKTTSAEEAWNMGDNKRNITYPSGANVNNAELYANSSSSEVNRSTRGGGITQYDMLSNGFKCRGANPDINYSGYNYIYMAFAENPFVSSTLIPTTAR